MGVSYTPPGWPRRRGTPERRCCMWRRDVLVAWYTYDVLPSVGAGTGSQGRFPVRGLRDGSEEAGNASSGCSCRGKEERLVMIAFRFGMDGFLGSSKAL